MRIESSELAMATSYQSQTRIQSHERFSSWSGDSTQSRRYNIVARSAVTQVSISEQARLSWQFERSGQSPATSAGANSVRNEATDVDSDPVTTLIRTMIEMLTGRAMNVFSSADMPPIREHPTLTSPAAQGSAAARPSRPGSGMTYDATMIREEHEQLSFSAEGTIHTSDGQEIKFSLDLQMERSYREESQVSVRTGDAVRKDPLVLNFAGPAAQLTDRFIQFDLGGNGQTQRLPGLATGSAYLVLDRNGDGEIDNGIELFGPTTDNGFAELALLDDDHNGWIDEGDPLFKSLGVWNPADAGGATGWKSLTSAGVGALALAHVRTPFALRGNDNADLGSLRDSGLFLNEDGRTGTLQEVDLTVG